MRKRKTHVKLNNPQRIIAVIMLAQIRLHSRDPNRRHALDLAVLAKEPQRQVDVVDRAVHEDPARELRVRHEEPARIQLVARLRPEHRRRANVAACHAPVCVAVRGVEASREAADYFLSRVLLDGFAIGVDDGLGLEKELVWLLE